MRRLLKNEGQCKYIAVFKNDIYMAGSIWEVNHLPSG